MKIFKSISSVQNQLSQLKLDNTLGFVATMGALHSGHLSLVERAKKENNFVIVSIFVNPTQFDKEDDLEKYPNQLEADLKLLKAVKCDFVFIPSVHEMYPKNINSIPFNFEGLDEVMEGAFRAGHFDGVGTIVKKLFEIIRPNNAYFGEKDFQQLRIIEKMVDHDKLPIRIIGCKIYREKDGLAMSSRNAQLSAKQRMAVPLIYEALITSEKLFQSLDINDIIRRVKKLFEKQTELKLEYFEITDAASLKAVKHKRENKKYRAFIAAYAGQVRLIDNIALN